MAYWRRTDPAGFYVTHRYPCPTCNGDGRVAGSSCADCEGYGYKTCAAKLEDVLAQLGYTAPVNQVSESPKTKRPRVTAKMRFILAHLGAGNQLIVNETGNGRLQVPGGSMAVPASTIVAMTKAEVVTINGKAVAITKLGRDVISNGQM